MEAKQQLLEALGCWFGEFFEEINANFSVESEE